jgi:hypothetical protein
MDYRCWIQGGGLPARGVAHQIPASPLRDLRDVLAEGGFVTHKRPGVKGSLAEGREAEGAEFVWVHLWD